MPVEIQTCPLCDKTENLVFDQREFHGYQVVNRLCSYCGLVFQSPRMSEEELETFYESEYRRMYQGSEGPVQKDLAIQKKRADALLSLMEKENLKVVNRHLDIGSSAGILLKKFKQTFESQVVGIEPGEAYRVYSQNQGLTVYESLEALDEASQPNFDLISIVHVLEHLPEPVSYLQRLKENHLVAEGLLLIEVPNLYAHDSFEVAHLVSFSARTLTQMVKKAGFQISSLVKHGHPRSKLIPLYLTLLANPGTSNQDFWVRKETGVRIKRHTGLLHRRILTKLFPRQAWLRLKE